MDRLAEIGPEQRGHPRWGCRLFAVVNRPALGTNRLRRFRLPPSFENRFAQPSGGDAESDHQNQKRPQTELKPTSAFCRALDHAGIVAVRKGGGHNPATPSDRSAE